MEWTQETTIEFINAYKKKEILWDPKHPLHFNRKRKELAWEELAAEINKPVGHCKKKMENVLSSLRRERMKIRKSIRAGKGRDEVYRSSWFAYKSLSFLSSKNESQESLNILQNASESPESEEIAQKTTLGSTNQLTAKKKKKAEDQVEKTSQIQTVSSSQLITDDSQHFGNMVAAKLRNYNYSVQCEIQNEIMGIFLKANRGFYDHYNSFPIQPNCSGEISQTYAIIPHPAPATPSSSPFTHNVISEIKSPHSTSSEEDQDQCG